MALEIDLTYPRRIIEELMVDECLIKRDTAGTTDDVWDPATLTYVAPLGDFTTIYGPDSLGLSDGRALEGRCMIGKGGQQQPVVQFDANVVPVTAQLYSISIPWDAPVIPEIEDLFVVLSSRNDPHLAGEEMIVKAVDFGTYVASRRMVVQRRVAIDAG